MKVVMGANGKDYTLIIMHKNENDRMLDSMYQNYSRTLTHLDGYEEDYIDRPRLYRQIALTFGAALSAILLREDRNRGLGMKIEELCATVATNSCHLTADLSDIQPTLRRLQSYTKVLDSYEKDEFCGLDFPDLKIIFPILDNVVDYVHNTTPYIDKGVYTKDSLARVRGRSASRDYLLKEISDGTNTQNPERLQITQEPEETKLF